MAIWKKKISNELIHCSNICVIKSKQLHIHYILYNNISNKHQAYWTSMSL